jgi:hypothetical protein
MPAAFLESWHRDCLSFGEVAQNLSDERFDDLSFSQLKRWRCEVKSFPRLGRLEETTCEL